ncbi:MAG: hypothetical protein R3E96_11930 [Planctomycetota bacterium]
MRIPLTLLLLLAGPFAPASKAQDPEPRPATTAEWCAMWSEDLGALQRLYGYPLSEAGWREKAELLEVMAGPARVSTSMGFRETVSWIGSCWPGTWRMSGGPWRRKKNMHRPTRSSSGLRRRSCNCSSNARGGNWAMRRPRPKCSTARPKR